MSELLSTPQAARVLGVAEQTLRNWRSTGQHELPFAKVGKLVRYDQRDLDAWLASRKQTVVRGGN